MELHASIDEADIGKVRSGQRVTFGVDSFPNKSFEGEVIQIRKAPKVTQNVVTYTVLVSAENPDLLLLPGMTATLRILVDETKGVLRVPNAALRFQPAPGALRSRWAAPPAVPEQESGGVPAVVWVLDADRQPSPVPIGIGVSDASAAELRSGPLAQGDEVVVGYTAEPTGSGWLGLRLGF
jgi:HlyD family secretion protein